MTGGVDFAGPQICSPAVQLVYTESDRFNKERHAVKNESISSALFALAIFSSAAVAGQPPVSTVQMVSPGNQTAQPVMMPGNSGPNVRQRQAYGQGYRYGNAVNGPNGNIIIWSAAPDNGYKAVPESNTVEAYPGAPVKYPDRQKPHYGDTNNPDYGD